MLIKEISYEDFDGNKRTEKFHFNLTKAELIELQTKYEGGLERKIERLSEKQNGAEIIALIKDIISMSYGVKSDDGKRMIKNQEVLDEFMQSEAYSELFMELAQDADAANKFITGIIPKGLREEAEKAMAAQNKDK